MSSEELKKENYEKILRASKKLFEKKGIKATTLVEIAKEAGVAKKTITNIFETKNNLIFLVMDRIYRDYFKHLDKFIKTEPYEQADGLEQIMMLLVERAKYYEKYPHCTRMILEIEGLEVNGEAEKKNCCQYLQTTRHIGDYFVKPLEKGQQDGSIKKSIHIDTMANMLFFSFGAAAQRLSLIHTNPMMDHVTDARTNMRSILNMTREFLRNESEHEMRLQKLIDEVPAGIGIYEIHGGKLSQTYMNEAFYKMLGMSRESRRQYFGDNTMTAANPEDVPSINKAMGKLMAGEDMCSVSYRIRCADDNWFWVHLSASVVERKEDYLRIYAAFSDYNTTMQAQQELENGRITMNSALQAAKVMTWRYDYKKKRITDSGTLGEAFQLPKVIDGLPQAILDMGFLEEPSVEDFRDLFRQVDTEKLASADVMSTVHSEYGSTWYRLIYTPTFDSAGKYVDAVGIAIDITDQKLREQKYEEQIRLNKIAAQGALATASYNLTQNYVSESESPDPTLQKIMEKESADAVLHGIREAIFDEKEQEMFGTVYDCKSMIREFGKGNTHIEIRHHLKGRKGWMQTSFDMIANPFTGDVEAIGILRDITDMVRAELIVNRLLTLDYQSIMTIDANTGEATPFRKEVVDPNLQELLTLQQELGDYSKGVEMHLRKYGMPDGVEKAIRDNSMEVVHKQLERMPFYESTYEMLRNGKIVHLRSIYAYLEDTRDIIVCAIQDITETFEQEEKQKEALSLALADAKKANEAKTAFLSRVSHDMRTPLNGILGLTTLMKERAADNRMSKDLAELEMSGQYLLNLINDTLDVSRIENGKLELHPSVLDGRSLFNNALGLAKTGIQEKNIHLQVHAEDLPFTKLYIDGNRIQQVVMNILGNAIKFTPEGGNINVYMKNLSIENGIITDELIIEDNGIGMDPQFLPHIFEAFSQEDATRTSSYQGTGLGMSITKQILNVMGGEISIESEPGKGTRVRMVIPMQTATEEQIEEWRMDQQTVQRDVILDGKRVLLCEDHPLNATIAARLLESKGILTDHAENGKVGVEMFCESAPGYYDAILMDIRMPVMDGLDAAKAIRALSRKDAHRIPIIAMTANAFDEDIRQTIGAGMDAHLSKPIKKEILYHTLGELLEAQASVRRQKILIVDDIDVNRAVMRSSLEQDYDIIEAEDGCRALQMLETIKGIDTVITDIQMPEMDGVELIRKIRENHQYQHIAIIANTQYGGPEQEEQLLAMGADDFVYKPTTAKIVEMRVRNVLRRM